MPEFTCATCGQPFSVRQDILARYPGWTPSICLPCRDRAKGKPPAKAAAARKAAKPRRRKAAAKKGGIPRAQVLERYDGGPQNGVFTDGACSGNPGPGGWGFVWVADGEIVAERHGHAPRTTNNRMELTALIEAYALLPEDAVVTIYSDSNLAVRTLNEWAAGWQARGWRRKGGAVENLDLVQAAYAAHLAHPKVELRWIKAHDGSRWNEYADSLATLYLREASP